MYEHLQTFTFTEGKVKVKVKVHPGTAHEGPKGK
jgi:hypothetical protein